MFHAWKGCILSGGHFWLRLQRRVSNAGWVYTVQLCELGVISWCLINSHKTFAKRIKFVSRLPCLTHLSQFIALNLDSEPNDTDLIGLVMEQFANVSKSLEFVEIRWTSKAKWVTILRDEDADKGWCYTTAKDLGNVRARGWGKLFFGIEGIAEEQWSSWFWNVGCYDGCVCFSFVGGKIIMGSRLDLCIDNMFPFLVQLHERIRLVHSMFIICFHAATI